MQDRLDHILSSPLERYGVFKPEVFQDSYIAHCRLDLQSPNLNTKDGSRSLGSEKEILDVVCHLTILVVLKHC